jgi:hypothetical protein
MRISKEGYLPFPTNRGSFEYANPEESAFHQPNREDPVVFAMRKSNPLSPISIVQIHGEFRSVGDIVRFDPVSKTFVDKLGIEVDPGFRTTG